MRPSAASAGRARRFVRDTLLRWGLDDLVDDAVLLASELATNAIVHAGTDADLSLDRFGQTVEVSVLDRYAERALPYAANPDSESEGGRGLFLLQAVAGHWGVEYRPDGKRVWFRLTSAVAAPPRGEAAAAHASYDAIAAGDAPRAAPLTLAADGTVRAARGDLDAFCGLAAASVPGRSLGELVVAGARSVLDACRRDGAWRGELELRHAEGHQVAVLATFAAFGGDDEPLIHALWVEQRLRDLVESRAPATAPTGAQAPGLLDPALAVRLPYDEFLLRVIESARTTTRGDAAYVAVLDEDSDALEIRAQVGLPDDRPREVLLPDEGAAARLDLLRLPLLVAREDDAPAAHGLLDDGWRSLVSTPVTVHGRVVGAIAVVSERAAAFDHDAAVTLQALADASALALDSARLAELERRRRGSLAFLAEASDLLGGTLDPAMTVAMVGQLLVPRLADWCAVWVEGTAAPYVWHHDEARLAAVREFSARAGEAVRSQAAEMGAAGGTVARRVPSLRARELDELRAGRDDEAMAEAVVDVARGGQVTVPLRARNRDLGRILVGRAPDRPFRANEISLLEDLARRAGLAVDNARLFRERWEIAKTLQSSLLPAEVPSYPAVEVGQVYEPAGDGIDVGGDFYDVFVLPDGALAFVVGDVCGKGTAAAAVTGLTRNSLRLLARSGRPVAEVMAGLNTAILDEGERSRFVTLLYGELRPRPDGAADLTLCCAGHPAPIVMGSAGVRRVGAPQPLLGVLDDAEFAAEHHRLEPGDAIVCFTDGVTERRSGRRMLGEEGLTELLERLGPLPAQAVAERIQRQVVEFAPEPPRDDLAVLVLRLERTA